jgi:two-component system LytT family sensor kinase
MLGNILRHYKPAARNTFNLIPWGLVLLGCWIFLSRGSMRILLQEHNAYLDFFDKTLPLRSGIAFLIIGWSILLNWIIQNLRTQSENQKRKTEIEKASGEAELVSLRQQLQPHFIFNSLNSISALIITKPEDARKMIHKLSDFLRGTLNKGGNQISNLDAELKHLELYLEIEEVRFGHRLKVEIEQDKNTNACQIPSLLLQPVVENAIKFGLYDTLGETEIKIQTKITDHHLQIIVSNPFDPETANTRQGEGFGLSSIRRRLFLMYGRNDLIKAIREENKFMLDILLPQGK